MITPDLTLIPSGYGVGKVYSVLPSDGAGDFVFTRGSVGTRMNRDGLIETVAIDVPRLNYEETGAEACPNLLLEPEGRNEVLHSEDFSNAVWDAESDVVITPNSASSPDGTLNADKIVFTNDGGIGRLDQDVTVLDGLDYTISIYARGEVGGEQVMFAFKDGSNAGSNGIIRTLTNEWVRYEETFTSTGTSRGLQVRFESATPAQTIYLWGAQLEQDEFATSYISTTTAEVVRNADLAIADYISNVDGGVLLLDMKQLVEKGENYTIQLDDDSSSDRVMLRYSASSNSIFAGIWSATTSQWSTSFNFGADTDFNKFAVRWQANDFSLWVNGVEVGTSSTTGTVPVSLTKVRMTSSFASTSSIGFKVKQLSVYDEYLSNADMIELTTI